MTKEILRPDEVAKTLGISKSTLYRWIQDGYLNAFKSPAGGLIRVRKSDLDLFMDRYKTTQLTIK